MVEALLLFYTGIDMYNYEKIQIHNSLEYM